MSKSALDIGAVGITGTLFGMPIEAMILGALSGALVNGMNKPEDRRNVVLSILVSMVIAGGFSPLLVNLRIVHVPFFNERHLDALNLAVPLMLGGGWSYGVPILNQFLKGKLSFLLQVFIRAISSAGEKK